MDDEVVFDWIFLGEAATDGLLMGELARLPRSQWAMRDDNDNTLLHYACTGDNLAAMVELLTSGMLDPNTHDSGLYPANYAISWGQPRALELLVVAGADLRARAKDDDSFLHVALKASQGNGARISCARVLVANGMRLSTVREDYRRFITPELAAFERGVLRCRAAVVAMLRVKRAGKLVRWDKFVLFEIAVCVWALRYNKGWLFE